jgi:HEAT repeat protein
MDGRRQEETGPPARRAAFRGSEPEPAGLREPGPSRSFSSLLHLQRTIGNRAVRRLMRDDVNVAGPTIQRQPAKTKGSPPSVPLFEQVNEQLAIIREGTLPLAMHRDPKNRALSFDDRVTLQFRRTLAAISRLGELKEPRAVPLLIGVLEDRIWGQPARGFSALQKQLLQQAAAESIGQIGGTLSLTKLNDLLTSKDPKERLIGGRALAGATGSQAVTALLAALRKETDAAVKKQIIRALGNVGRSSSKSQEKELIARELVRVMESSAVDLQQATVNALGVLQVKSAVDSLLKLARQHLGSAGLVSDIAAALGEIGDSRAVELLGILLKDHGSMAVRSQAALALGKIRGPKALAALRASRATEKDRGVKASINLAIHGKPAILQWEFP